MAQIDTSIYGNMLRPVKSVAEYDAEYAQAQDNKLARMLNQLKIAETQRGFERQNKLQALLGGMGGATDEQRVSALRGGAYFTEADALEKSLLDRQKTKAEVDAKGAATAKDYAEMVRKGLGFVFANPSPEAANSAISILEKQTGKDLSAYRQQIAGFTTPEQFKTWAAGHTLEVDKMLPKVQTTNLGGNMSYEAVNPLTAQVTQTGVKPITETANNIANNQRIAQEGVLNRGVQIRGQNLTDARQRERLDLDKGSSVADAGGPNQVPLVKRFGKAPAGHRWKDDGSVEKIPGFESDKPLNEGQGKSNLFGTRMKEANRIITSLTGKYDPAAVNAKIAAGDVPGVGGALGWAGNAMLSAEGQQAEQAQRDFINAVLRRESGAVISPSEFDNARKQYFPQPSDKPENIAQKKANRELAIKGMEAEVPGGFRTSPTLTNPGSTGGASGGWSIKKVGE